MSSFKKGDKVMGLSFQMMAWEKDGLPKPVLVAGKIIKSVTKPHLGLCHLVKLVPGLVAPFPLTKSGNWWIRDNDARTFVAMRVRKAIPIWNRFREYQKKARDTNIQLAEAIY